MLTERGVSDHMDGYFPSWFKRANFVRVRDLRDPAACGCRFPSHPTDAIYSTKRKLRTEHSHNPHRVSHETAPFRAARAMATETAGARRSLTFTKFARSSHEERCPSARSETPRSVSAPQQRDNRLHHTFLLPIPLLHRFTAPHGESKITAPAPKIFGESREPF